jgi:hypothetical protein
MRARVVLPLLSGPVTMIFRICVRFRRNVTFRHSAGSAALHVSCLPLEQHLLS